MRDLMRRFFKVLLLASLVLAACEKSEPQEVPSPEAPAAEDPIGTYEYDGKEYPIYSVSYAEDDTQMYVRVSPFKEGEKQTTYAVVGINVALEGAEIDVAKAWHNDDYYFIYEDPIMYYSQYRHLQSGTIMMRREAPGSIRVSADLLLPDGKTFRLDLCQ